jgi:hypothetical protein
MHDIFVEGNGMLKDPDSGNFEVIQFRGAVTTANIVLDPEEIVREGAMYPHFAVKEVVMKMDKENTVVVAHGQTPLFKSKKFEEAIKKWVDLELERSVIPEIKKKFEEVEKQVWINIPFEYKGIGFKVIYSLAEEMVLND